MTAAVRVPRYALSESISERALHAAYRVLGNSVLSSSLDHYSYAQIARAKAYLHNAGHPYVSASDVTSTLDTLWAARYTNSGSGHFGFGLSYAYDAFGDATTNPSTTIYTVTTGLAGMAFLEGYLVSGNSTYLTYAEDCATTMLNDCWGFVSGSDMGAWYSDQAADQGAGSSYCVYNPNGLLLAILCRLNTINGTSFSATKETGIRALFTDGEQATGWWYYGTSGAGSGANQTGHHTLIVEGLAWAAMTPLADSLTWLWSTSGYLYPASGCWAIGNPTMEGGLNNGAPVALGTLVLNSSFYSDADMLANLVANNVNSSGVPADALTSSPLPSDQQRSYSDWAFGLARYAAHKLGDGSLLP